MIYPKIPLAQSIIELLRQNDIQNCVISPGSRNAPLTIGFANNKNFSCYSIVDERCAAFFALGIAQQTQKPVVLVCTSGSALLNYYPAFAEAFYSQISLIVISADRPKSKIDIGDGQTIRQENVFANHSLFNANLTENASEENDDLVLKAIQSSIELKGPVHINVPLEEPLYETVTELSVQPKHKIAQTKSTIFNENINEYIKIWNQSRKKLFLIGCNQPNVLSHEIVNKIGEDTSTVVLTEVTSNLHHPNFIGAIDTLITPFSEDDFNNFKPDILITFGGMVVSKRIKAFLRKHQPTHHWHIDTLRAYDTFGCLTKHFKTDPQTFFNAFLKNTATIESNYFDQFRSIYNSRIQKRDEYLSKIRFSDLKVFEKIITQLPKNSMLQISNSAAIRYAQLIDIDSSISIFCNRGTSGIDGSTSTAIGAAVGSNKPTVLITGDIGFFYDSNALWNNYLPNNFKIILINNGGGGIFRILPGHQENMVFNTFFETHHNLNAQKLSEMYGFEYAQANDLVSLNEKLEVLFLKNDIPFLLEINTPTACNESVLQNFFRFIK
jgi:2-succinyl-5-enolpyruvyl-6-hydroxy-3-cyclohexene-1-carboxylate synthase